MGEIYPFRFTGAWDLLNEDRIGFLRIMELDGYSPKWRSTKATCPECHREVQTTSALPLIGDHRYLLLWRCPGSKKPFWTPD